MRSRGLSSIVLVIILTAGCGGQAAPPSAEAVARQAEDSAGVRIAKLVRLDYGAAMPTPPGEDDLVVPVDIGEYDESRTTGVMRLGADASDLTTTFHRTNVPGELKLVPDDLSSMTTRVISIDGSGTYEHRADRRDVPAGKTWLHHSGSGCGTLERAVGSLDLRAILSPEVLRKLTAPAPSPGEVIDGVGTVVHAGSAAQSEFSGPAPGVDPATLEVLRERFRSVEVSWRLWAGPDGLPRRLRLEEAMPAAEEGMPRTSVTEIDFTGWGSDVTVVPPPAEQVHEAGSCLAPEPR
ncbi:hypothetical protein [Nonomuraea fuscirosea]|uniref:hypothetical protein n=1 Tax=Nonomuraea fuscirosea TaxID=1291556 RepID=UPI0011B26ECF|nr:hypothetical protein [Nonomuraea fuscirosea]